jgi:hypothetical protein
VRPNLGLLVARRRRFDEGAVEQVAALKERTTMSRTTLPVAGACLLAGLLLARPGPAQEAPGCTLTQGYWKTHPETWPVDTLDLGGAAYAKDDLIVLLSTSPRGDATYILAVQLIAAKLNVMNGADSSGIAITIAQADLWLAQVGLGSWPTGPVRSAGLALASQLDAFNKGLSGVPHCEEGPNPTPTPTPPPV